MIIRIRARLNSTRVPTGSTVRLTLTRRIHHPIRESQSPPLSPVDSERMMATTSPTKTSQLSRNSSVSQKGDLNSNDEKSSQDGNLILPPPPSLPSSFSPPHTSSLKTLQYKESSWASDEEEVSSPVSQAGSTTPKSSPRPKQKFSISPTPSPLVQQAYTPSPGHTSFRLKPGFLGTKLPAKGGPNLESKYDVPSSTTTTDMPLSSKQIPSNHDSDDDNHSEFNDESYESDGSGGKTIPRSSIGRREVVTPNNLSENKTQILGLSVPPMSSIKPTTTTTTTDKPKLNPLSSISKSRANTEKRISSQGNRTGYDEVIINNNISAQLLQELQYESVDIVMKKIENNDNELEEIERMLNELEETDDEDDELDDNSDIPPPPPPFPSSASPLPSVITSASSSTLDLKYVLIISFIY